MIPKSAKADGEAGGEVVVVCRDEDGPDGEGARDQRQRHPGRRINRQNFGLSFGLKNHLSFGLRFPEIRTCSKMGSLDMSRNQNGILIRFSSRKSSQN